MFTEKVINHQHTIQDKCTMIQTYFCSNEQQKYDCIIVQAVLLKNV